MNSTPSTYTVVTLGHATGTRTAIKTLAQAIKRADRIRERYQPAVVRVLEVPEGAKVEDADISGSWRVAYSA